MTMIVHRALNVWVPFALSLWDVQLTRIAPTSRSAAPINARRSSKNARAPTTRNALIIRSALTSALAAIHRFLLVKPLKIARPPRIRSFPSLFVKTINVAMWSALSQSTAEWTALNA